MLQHFSNIEILFENDDFIAVNKPEGISSIHERNKESLHTLLERERNIKLFPVHRLDKEVSGIIVFAKNGSAHKFLNDLFEQRKVKKKYIALVHGLVKNDEGIINRPIKQFGSGRMGISQSGKECITKYKVLKRQNLFTLLEIETLTGRRHQIRVHLYSIGHPIVGDLRYGNKTEQKKYHSLMLHAKSVSFKLKTGEDVSISAEIPNTFTILQ